MDSGVRQFNIHTFEWPLLPVGIHTDGDARTCSQRRQQQLVWVRSDVTAAYRDRFISLEQVRADNTFCTYLNLPASTTTLLLTTFSLASTYGSFLIRPKTLAQIPLEDFAGSILR